MSEPSFDIRRVFVALILTGLACAPTAPPPTTPSNPATGSNTISEPKRATNQIINVALNTLGANLDPHAFINLNGRQYDLFETLVGMNDKAEPVNTGLATSWKLIDATTWQFVLYPDSRWHDGTPVTADDVKFSFDRVLFSTPPMPPLQRILTIEKVEVDIVDKLTVNIVTKAPDPILIRRATAHTIVPKAAVERLGARFGQEPVGSGPLKIKEFVANTRVVMVPFTDHPRHKAMNSEVRLTALPETSARVAGLKTGEIDFSHGVGVASAETLLRDGMKRYVISTGQSGGVRLSAIADTPLKDKRVRQAINYAVDKEGMAKNIYGGIAKLEQGQIVQPEVFGFNPNLKPYPYDPAMAKKLLAEAGYPNGFKITYEQNVTGFGEFKDMGLVIQQNLKDVGIDVEYVLLSDVPTYIDKFNGVKERAPMFGTTASFAPVMDGDFGMLYFWGQQAPAIRYYQNADYDRYFGESTRETDSTKRLALLQKALEVFREDPPYLFTIQNVSVSAYGPKIQGVTERFDGNPFYYQFWRSE